MIAEPRRIGALIGHDSHLEVSGAAHISVVGIFRGIIDIQAVVGMMKVSLRKLCEHSHYSGRWDGRGTATVQIPISLHSHIHNSVRFENVHQHRVERERYQKAHQTVMDPEQVPRVRP